MTCDATAEAWVWLKIGLGAWIALALVAWVLAAVLWVRAWRRRSAGVARSVPPPPLREAGETADDFIARHEAWMARARGAAPGRPA
jgi:hypothetical protein